MRASITASTAATVAGLNPNRYRFASYVLSSLLGGTAGILLASLPEGPNRPDLPPEISRR
mgnify:CR=1 FL=1